MTWQTYAADVPRFVLPNNGLLIEGQRTNLITDPRTAFGTGWANTGVATATPIIGPDVISGSATRVTETAISEQHVSAISAISFVSGTNYSFSAILRAVTCGTAQLFGGAAAFSTTAFANFDLANGVIGSAGTGVIGHKMRSLGDDWWFCEFTAPATATASSSSSISLTVSPSSTRAPTYIGTSRELDVFWTQVEVGAFASTPILPPVGTPGASTRGSDIVTAPLASLGVSNQGTFLGTFMLPQAAPAAANQFLIQIENGNDLYRIFNIAGLPSIRGGRVTSGVTSTVTLADMTPGTAFRVGFTFDSAGRMALSMEGAAPTIVTGGPAGMVTLRVGNNTGNAAPMFGECRFFQAIPRALSDAELAAAVAALPL